MSAIDLLLSQKTIILSIGFALLVLLAAITLWLVSNLRKRAVQRRAERAAAANIAEASADMDEMPEAVLQAEDAPTHPKKVKATPTAPKSAMQTTPAAAAPAPTGVTVTPAPTPATSTSTEAPADSAMQDLLSSVFSDEDALARYANLLKGVKPVSMQELAAFSSRVAGDLRGGKQREQA